MSSDNNDDFSKRDHPKKQSIYLDSKLLNVAFIQKGLMRLSFLQIDEPNYFPELEFWFLFLF